MARDSYSYLHFVLVVGIAGAAVGMKTVLAHVDAPLDAVSATALLGGVALYLVGTVAFKLRTLRRSSLPRLVAVAVLLVLLWPASSMDAIATLGAAAAVLWVLVAYEALRYAATRDRIRHGDPAGADAPDD
jgi:low temperature requirement protein LtrA